jgi:hypothetical protein
MHETCQTPARHDLAGAIVCLMGLGAGIGGGPRICLDEFRKSGCVPGEFVGQPGDVCDYLAGVRSNNPITRNMFAAFGRELSTARFVKTGSGRLMVRSQ